jgi:hypothetical protein
MVRFLFGSIVALGGYACLIPMVWMGMSSPLYLPLPAVAGVIAGILIGGMFDDLTCEVWDAGDVLFVRDGAGREASVFLKDIRAVSYLNPMTSYFSTAGKAASLTLDHDAGLGREIRFLPIIDPRIDIDRGVAAAYIEQLRHRVASARKSGLKPGG